MYVPTDCTRWDILRLARKSFGGPRAGDYHRPRFPATEDGSKSRAAGSPGCLNGFKALEPPGAFAVAFKTERSFNLRAPTRRLGDQDAYQRVVCCRLDAEARWRQEVYVFNLQSKRGRIGGVWGNSGLAVPGGTDTNGNIFIATGATGTYDWATNNVIYGDFRC